MLEEEIMSCNGLPVYASYASALTTMKKIICTNSEKLSENIQKAHKKKGKRVCNIVKLWNYW